MAKQKYTPNYPDVSVARDDVITPAGVTPRQAINLEEAAQMAVAESPVWLLARVVNSTPEKLMPRGADSRTELEKLGFRILGIEDSLFYEVQPPEGWDKSTEGFWTKVVDDAGVERLNQFFKGAFYVRDAFINICEPKKRD